MTFAFELKSNLILITDLFNQVKKAAIDLAIEPAILN